MADRTLSLQLPSAKIMIIIWYEIWKCLGAQRCDKTQLFSSSSSVLNDMSQVVDVAPFIIQNEANPNKLVQRGVEKSIAFIR